jgi:hypothetical protein
MNAILTVAIKELGRKSLTHPNIELQSFYQELKNTSSGQFKKQSLWSCALINWITHRVELNRNSQLTPHEWLTFGKDVDNEPLAGDIVISEIDEDGTPQILISVLAWPSTDKKLIYCLGGDENHNVAVQAISIKAVLGIRRLEYKSMAVPA